MIKIKRDYLSFPELAERWKLPVDSLDLRRAVMSGLVKPAIIRRTALPRVAIQDGMPVPLLDHQNQPVLEEVQGWCFPVCPIQTGAFEALFPVVARLPNPTDADGLYALVEPISLTALLADAVVMTDDIESAEATNGEASELSGKRKNSVLSLISVMAADGYGWRDTGRSDTVGVIAGAAAEMGISISEGTVLRYLRLAHSEYPPAVDYFQPQHARHSLTVHAEATANPVPVSPKPKAPSPNEIGESQMSCETE